ncbi:MAG TPA: hypothetical protein G4O15_06960 [Dehalococcoidia bacterium]|nr:hypothetical protein [Dehalococcoidia bacterium]
MTRVIYRDCHIFRLRRIDAESRNDSAGWIIMDSGLQQKDEREKTESRNDKQDGLLR